MVDAVLDLTQHAARRDPGAARARARRAARHDHGRVPPRAAATTVNIRIHRALFASGAGGDRAHAGQRRGRAQADADEPRDDAGGRRRAARPRRQRGSVTGSLTLRSQAGRVRDRAGDPDRLERASAACSAAAAAATTTRPDAIERRTIVPRERPLGAQPRGQPQRDRAVLIARELDQRRAGGGPAAAVARAFRNGAPPRAGPRRDRRPPPPGAARRRSSPAPARTRRRRC